jgi:phosphohistidine swiveling domain-containing protein
MKNEFHYERHQRDYTLLLTSVVFGAYGGKSVLDYFSIVPAPGYIVIENGVLYHYAAKEDYQRRARAWIRKYKTVARLRDEKRKHDVILKKCRTFLAAKHQDPAEALRVLHTYFVDLLPVILISLDIPDYAGTQPQGLSRLALQIRKENQDIYRVGLDVQMRLLARLERQEKVKLGLLQWLTAVEFERYLKTKALPPKLAQRTKFVMVRCNGRRQICYYSRSALLRFALDQKNDAQFTELRGSTAYPGEIEGKVRVLRFVRESVMFRSGEILVASMTDPRYLSAMKRAAAIVTDEGGITCHAAIVSRELKIPCVVGTKYATQVLKTGDRVEVDATKGVVRKL